MILFDLRCTKGHVFEAWFRDGDAFDAQAGAHEIACPLCGSRRIGKAPMAPRIGKGGRSKTGVPASREQAQVQAPSPPSTPSPSSSSTPPASPAGMMQALREIRRQVEANCDYVGERFAEEARRIHYGETDRRNIYGEASDAEARALDEEGVEFKRVPWVPRHDS